MAPIGRVARRGIRRRLENLITPARRLQNSRREGKHRRGDGIPEIGFSPLQRLPGVAVLLLLEAERHERDRVRGTNVFGDKIRSGV